jgi:putative transposase
MKGKRYSDEQIIGILKAHEAGTKVADLVRRHSISEQSFYRWKSKYGGMEVSEAKRLRELEAKSTQLKKLLAEAELDKAMLNRKRLVGYLQEQHRVSQRRACRVIPISRKAVQYVPQRPQQDARLITRLKALGETPAHPCGRCPSRWQISAYADRGPAAAHRRYPVGNEVLPEDGFAAGYRPSRDLRGINPDRTTANQICEKFWTVLERRWASKREQNDLIRVLRRSVKPAVHSGHATGYGKCFEKARSGPFAFTDTATRPARKTATTRRSHPASDDRPGDYERPGHP